MKSVRPLRRVAALWDMVDGPMPRGVLGLGDPDVHLIAGTPTMFLGGFATSFRNRLYMATLPEGADPTSRAWQIDVDGRRRARPLVADPPKGGWDGAGMHTPSYVPAVGSYPERIYYTGRASRKQYGATSSYAIGVLEHVRGRWVRRDEPLIRGAAPRMSALEPLVVYDHDQERYLMWYQANLYEIGPGDLPDYELRVTESVDGIHWRAPAVFATREEGFFDNAIARTPDGWLMVLSRGANLHNTAGLPPQGLWLTTATALTPDRAEWSQPHHVFRTDEPGTPSWIARGTYGPAVLPLVDQHDLVVFTTGVRAAPRWPRLVTQRLLRGKLTVPAPFYLSVAAVTIGNDR